MTQVLYKYIQSGEKCRLSVGANNREKGYVVKCNHIGRGLRQHVSIEVCAFVSVCEEPPQGC